MGYMGTRFRGYVRDSDPQMGRVREGERRPCGALDLADLPEREPDAGAQVQAVEHDRLQQAPLTNEIGTRPLLEPWITSSEKCKTN